MARFSWFTLFFCIVLIGIFFDSVWMHEKVHQEIYDSFGIKSHIDLFGHFPDAVTITDNLINDSQCPDATCGMQHNMVENVGYQLQPFIVLIGIGFLILILIAEEMLNAQRRFHQILLGKES